MSNEKDDPANDPLLNALSESITPIAKEFEADLDSALLVIGAKEFVPANESDEEEIHHIKTFFGAVGHPEVIADALYNELATLAAEGELGLYYALRDAILTFGEDHDLLDDENLMESSNGKTLH